MKAPTTALRTTIRHSVSRFGRAPRTGPRVFGIGAAKTGTHTIGEMFSDRIVSAHEADAERLIKLHLERLDSGDPTRLHGFLRKRDESRRLWIDASQVNVFLLDDLEALFPGSRYVLTLRPPISWLRSMIDDSLRRDVSDVWIRFRTYRFGEAEGHPPEEAPLAELGLYRIDGYLGYWGRAVGAALERLPADRLMIVRTEEIGPRAGEIARFCGLPEPDRPPARTHSFSNPERFHLLDRIPADYLIERTETVVGEAARRLLPGWSAEADLASIRPA